MYTINHYKKSLGIQNWQKRRALRPPLSVLPFTVHHRRQRTHKRGHDCWGDNPGRIHTAILASVRDHIDRYQLQGRNIQNQKRAHLIAGNPAALSICRHR